MKEGEEGSVYSYVKFYSARAAAKARATVQRGDLTIPVSERNCGLKYFRSFDFKFIKIYKIVTFL